MPKDFSELKRFFEEQVPFNRYLGLKVEHCEPGLARMTVPFRSEFVGDPRRPALHGGILSAVIDACGGLAVWTHFSPEDRISTVDMRVDYLRPGPAEELRVESRVVRMGNRVSVVHSVVTALEGDGEAVAEGRAVYNTRRAGQA